MAGLAREGQQCRQGQQSTSATSPQASKQKSTHEFAHVLRNSSSLQSSMAARTPCTRSLSNDTRLFAISLNTARLLDRTLSKDAWSALEWRRCLIRSACVAVTATSLSDRLEMSAMALTASCWVRWNSISPGTSSAGW
jgi:hypothetical protein